MWLPQGDDPHSSLSFEAPGEDDEEGASSDGESAVSTTETADITLVDPEVCEDCALLLSCDVVYMTPRDRRHHPRGP